MQITLPDGSIREFPGPVTGFDVAGSIGAGLLRAAVAIEVNGKEQDLSEVIGEDSSVSIITVRNPSGLDIMRHTLTAQVLARAIRELYPGAKLAIGPTIENGFYYDVDVTETISIDDFPKIESKMTEIIAQKNNITRKMIPRVEAIQLFHDRNEPYKVDIIERATDQDSFPLYFQEGSDFVDLCRGPHVPNLDRIGAFKLTKLAGAYWRGDSNNKMITRIYGTAWSNKKELRRYLNMLKEAEKRDHRKLGKQLNLFHLQEEAIGQVFWHDKGWMLYTKLKEYIREKLRRYDYQEVNTPRIVSNVLFRKSGHWDKFGTKNMFITNAYGQEYALKPMNCPCHVQIFNQGTKSYRDLPIRMSEFGNCMRHETRGALHGIMRVASMVQDDGHIFCTHDQVEDEVVILCELIKEIYTEFGFDEPTVKFSDRPEQRVGSDQVWDEAEAALRKACDKANLTLKLNPGEGAFYGPKLEFVLRDSIGRHWQCGTIQLDFNLPSRLDAKFTDENNSRSAPVMIHRALLGSLERFTGILIEHFAGHFPLWIAPIQIVLMGISEKQNEHVEAMRQKFKSLGFRVIADTSDSIVNAKVKEHSLQKIPLIGVFGEREIANGTVTVRRFGSNRRTVMPLEELISTMQNEVETRALPMGFGEKK